MDGPKTVNETETDITQGSDRIDLFWPSSWPLNLSMANVHDKKKP